MPSPFMGIDLTSNALRAFQRELDVTGHNIANVNTPGYSRQVVDLSTADPSTVSGVHPFDLGNGVNVNSVNRIKDIFLQARLTGAQGDLGKSGTLTTGLSQIEALFQDTTGSGISAALDQFFNSWSGLAANPNDSGQKIQVQQSAQTLAQAVRQLYGNLTDLHTQQIGQVTQTFDQIDQLTTQISQLNDQIRQEVGKGATPNDLLDKRDKAVQDLSALVDIHTATFADGSLTVYMNQFTLVDTTGSHAIPRTYDTVAGTVTDGTTTFNVKSGQLSGLFETINHISSYQSQLDSLANTLRTSVNGLYANGVNSAGVTGAKFFNDSTPPAPQTGAIDLDLDPAIQADAQAISAGTTGAAGDGGLAQSISKARDTAMSGLGSKTFTSFYANLVGAVGRDSAFYKQSNDTQSAVSQQITNQIQSQSGVSLDDEMANMLRFQRSYQAAASALHIFDQVTSDLINLLNR